MLFWTCHKQFLSANRPFDICVWHLSLFGEGMAENRQVPPVKEVENPEVDAAFAYSQLVDAVPQHVGKRSPQLMAKLSQSRNRRNAGFICLLVSMAKILQAVEHRDIVAAAIVRVREKKKKAETKVDNKEPDVSKPAAILEDQPGAEPDRTGRDAAARATGETESAAPAPRAEPARAAGAEESGADTAGPRPEVEVGPHGPILRQFRHDPTGAIDALLKAHTGDAVGALYNPHVGEVDIVWGETAAKGFGLAHILEGHPEPGLLSELARVFESMTIGPAEGYARQQDCFGERISHRSGHDGVARNPKNMAPDIFQRDAPWDGKGDGRSGWRSRPRSTCRADSLSKHLQCHTGTHRAASLRRISSPGRRRHRFEAR